MAQLSITEHLEYIIQSPQFQTFCEFQCPLTADGCHIYCPFYTMKTKQGSNTP